MLLLLHFNKRPPSWCDDKFDTTHRAARTRRLSDKRRLLFHTACDEAAFSVAEQRLNQLCQHVASLAIPPVGAQRRKPESLSGACERLATLLLWKAENGTDAAAQEDEDSALSPKRGRRPEDAFCKRLSRLRPTNNDDTVSVLAA